MEILRGALGDRHFVEDELHAYLWLPALFQERAYVSAVPQLRIPRIVIASIAPS
jgi:hypothetical protein